MSAAKHTPGPWSVNDNPMAMSEYCILAESRGTGFGASVATANQREGYNSLSPEEAKANARLIAASPELLADLIEAAATLRSYEAQHRAKNTAESTVKAEVNATLAARFEATIAKAEGAAP